MRYSNWILQSAFYNLPTANKEFCEDIPDVTETVFVLDYLHDSLNEMPIDFRIIKDVENLGRYATWDDIARLDDIDRETVLF